MMIGNDQSLVRNKRSGAAVDFANAVHQTSPIGVGVKDLVGRQLEAFGLQVQRSQLADGEHAFIRKAVRRNGQQAQNHYQPVQTRLRTYRRLVSSTRS